MTLLSKTECSALRGIAITGIFLHNYLHWLKPMLKENEYIFVQKNVDAFTDCLTNWNIDFPLQLISFFGHYGVPVFLFLSGYGLVLKYESTTSKQVSASSFIWKHCEKLLMMMLLGFALFAIVDYDDPVRYHWKWDYIVRNLTMTANLFPEPHQVVYPGPYWFFGLMVQLYIIYRLIFYKRSNWWIYAAIAICLISQACCFDDPDGKVILWIRYNSIGSLLPFGIGILLARCEKIPDIKEHIDKLFASYRAFIIAIASLLFVLAGSLNFYSWLIVPAFVITLHIGFTKLFQGRGLVLLNWIGTISSAIFVCHPITRKIFIQMGNNGEIIYGLTLYIISTILLALVFHYLFAKANKILK